MLAVAFTVALILASAAAGALASAVPNPPARIARALWAASRRYGVPFWQLRNVSWCESRYQPTAWNPEPVDAYGEHSQGLFGFLPSTWRGTPYARYPMDDPWAAAMAAAWLVRHDGSWREWVCQPY